MIPQIGQHVKCLLKENIIAEGIVEEWSDNFVQLLSLDKQSILIIYRPSEIVLVKIIINEQIVENKRKDPLIQTNLEEQFQEVYEQPSSDDLRNKKLVELKALLVKQEKKIVTEKLKDHSIEEVKEIKYGYPGFFAKQSIK